MAIALTLQQFLEGRAIDFDVLTHERTTSTVKSAEACQLPADCVAKAVLLKSRSDYLLAVVPASCRVEVDDVCTLLDETYSVASEEEISTLFADCDKGAIPPLGSAYGLESVIDEQLDEPTDIYLEAGDHRSLIHLTQQEFSGLTWDSYHGRIAMRS